MLKKIALLTFAFGAFVLAEDMTATTSKGATVILHDNGRWEYYQNNARVRDIRTSAIPKDMQTVISIDYEPIEKLQKDMRMRLDADLATEEEIRDSLRTLPSGGIVHFCAQENQVHRGNPRNFTYTIWVGKKQIYKDSVSEAKAVPSETSGVSYLVSVPIYSKLHGKPVKARVENGQSVVDFNVR